MQSHVASYYIEKLISALKYKRITVTTNLYELDTLESINGVISFKDKSIIYVPADHFDMILNEFENILKWRNISFSKTDRNSYCEYSLESIN